VIIILYFYDYQRSYLLEVSKTIYLQIHTADKKGWWSCDGIKALTLNMID